MDEERQENSAQDDEAAKYEEMIPEVAAEYWKQKAEELREKLKEAEARLERATEDVDTFLSRVDFYRQIMAKCLEVAEALVPKVPHQLQHPGEMRRGCIVETRKMVAQSLFDRATRYEYEKELTHTLMDAVREINKPPEPMPMPTFIGGTYGEAVVSDGEAEALLVVTLPQSLRNRVQEAANEVDPAVKVINPPSTSDIVKRALIDYFQNEGEEDEGDPSPVGT